MNGLSEDFTRSHNKSTYMALVGVMVDNDILQNQQAIVLAHYSNTAVGADKRYG